MEVTLRSLERLESRDEPRVFRERGAGGRGRGRAGEERMKDQDAFTLRVSKKRFSKIKVTYINGL